ncbi:aldehyde dehydrogenase [Arthrobacter sp. W4I7]|uniref:aldehyde dehydrogenase family protein n=1 Tax=Arthrobacter sp. W4I7 TaxID=3042296 RepID=UPI00278966CE|nr:aldehyde dehydrogenase family protein [Arthrobacter sp. W4I7]MDQ0691334.1 acyl-CoA reductase-like NAD-dependent aldehyde dehydrogenase [Arthrobacter sp. W4I7]
MTIADVQAPVRFPEFDPERQYGMIIAGQSVQAETGNTFRCYDPFEEAEWGYVPDASAADVDRAVAAAQAAQPAWAATPPARRLALFQRWAALVREHVPELARTMVHENGKTITEMTMAMAATPNTIEFCGHYATVIHGDTITPQMPEHSAWTTRVPVGVVAAITPWNNPIGLLAWKLFPALAAGNTVIVKPSEVTPVSTIRLVELALEAGFPPGVVSVITGAGLAGAALVDHPGVDKVAFTGSTATGKRIGQSTGGRLVRTTLELGGKGPNIVFPDANLDKAIQGLVTGLTAGTGQACNAGSRIIVHEDIKDEVVARLIDALAHLVIGDPLDPDTDIGPIASRAQYAKVSSYLDIAESEATTTFVTGARRAKQIPGIEHGLFIEPTVYETPDPRSRVRCEEIFGPIGALITFRTEDEAIQIANDTEYGLVGGLWTTDINRARRVATKLDVGVAWINTWRAFSGNVPFGGRKSSGVGHEMGIDIFEEYTEVKAYWLGPDDS